MQQSVKPQKTGGNSQYQSIIIAAITLFALAGAILGFAIGALNHPRTPQQAFINNNNNNGKQTHGTKPTAAPTITPTPSDTPKNLGCPEMFNTTNIDNTNTMTLIAKDTSAPATPGHCDSQTIKSDNITCRIWLAKASDGPNPHPVITPEDKNLFNNPAMFPPSFPGEVPNGLVITNGVPQTQMCKQGQANWTWALSPSLAKGKYFIVGLTSWGRYINWSWSALLTKQ